MQMLRENREEIILNKNRFLYLILALIIISSIIFAVGRLSAKDGKEPDSAEPEAPATLEQVVEEFNEEFAEDGETVDPETFSEYTEEYEIEIQEDDVVNIN